MNFSNLPTTANGIELQTINAIQFPGTSIGGRTLHTLRWMHATCKAIAGHDAETFHNRFPERMREMFLIKQDADYIWKALEKENWIFGAALDGVDIKEFSRDAERFQTCLWIFKNMLHDLNDERSADQKMGAMLAIKDAYLALNSSY